MHVKHAALLKLKQAALILLMQLFFRFNNAACFNNTACRFSAFKITPHNFPANKKSPHPFFSHS